jgi:ADP-heptose:LPS heptosyltransferase
VKRYQGEDLPDRPIIAVVANDALGNYAISTPLVKMLRARHAPRAIHYYSGARVQELWSVDRNIEKGFNLLGSPPNDTLRAAHGPYDLVVNIEQSSWPKCFTSSICEQDSFVCGPALAPDARGDWAYPEDERGDLWRDQGWVAPDLAERYDFLESGFVAEVFCRLAYLDGPVPKYSIPTADPERDIPELLIATSASLPEKLWTADKWIELLRKLGMTAGLIGAKPNPQQQFWQGFADEERIVASGLVQDLRGEMKLPEVVGALGRARRVISLDNGIMHLAASTGTPTTSLFRHGIHRLWAPPYSNLTVLTPGEGVPVSAITVDEVANAD